MIKDMLVVLYVMLIPSLGWAQYAPLDLGTLGGGYSTASDVNELGHVVGMSELADTPAHAFLWTPTDGMRDLGTLPGTDWSAATAINDLDQVVGSSWDALRTTERAFSWTPAGGMIAIGGLDGSFTYASAVSNRGAVVGTHGLPMNQGTRAFLWTPSEGMVDLGTLGGNYSNASDINEGGVVVGSSRLGDGIIEHAFLWTEAGGMVDLGTLGGDISYAFGINESGAVVGSSTLPGGERHAFVWTAASGMVALSGREGTDWCDAWDINEQGDVAGGCYWAPDSIARYFAVSWSSSLNFELTDLSSLGGEHANALAINNSGQIAGWSTNASGMWRPTLWVRGTDDSDHDGVMDTIDNCPERTNPNQEDLDGDGLGDVCDSHVDARAALRLLLDRLKHLSVHDRSVRSLQSKIRNAIRSWQRCGVEHTVKHLAQFLRRIRTHDNQELQQLVRSAALIAETVAMPPTGQCRR